MPSLSDQSATSSNVRLTDQNCEYELRASEWKKPKR